MAARPPSIRFPGAEEDRPGVCPAPSPTSNRYWSSGLAATFEARTRAAAQDRLEFGLERSQAFQQCGRVEQARGGARKLEPRIVRLVRIPIRHCATPSSRLFAPGRDESPLQPLRSQALFIVRLG